MTRVPSNNAFVTNECLNDIDSVKQYFSFFERKKNFCIKSRFMELEKIECNVVHLEPIPPANCYNIMSINYQCGLVIITANIVSEKQKINIFCGNSIDCELHDQEIKSGTKVVFPLSWDFSFQIYPLENFTVSVWMDKNLLCTLNYPVQSSCGSEKYLIHEINDSLTSDECQLLIEYYNNHEKDKDIAIEELSSIDAHEVIILRCDLHHHILYRKLLLGLKSYMSRYPDPLNFLCDQNIIETEEIRIRLYKKNKSQMHKDIDARPNRILSFIWYLNNVDNGGESIIYNENGVKHEIFPYAGKLVLFPAAFGFIHSEEMPISNDKFVIAGWINAIQ